MSISITVQLVQIASESDVTEMAEENYILKFITKNILYIINNIL